MPDGSNQCQGSLHAAETSVERLLGGHLPLLLRAAADISADYTRLPGAPQKVPSAASRPSAGTDLAELRIPLRPVGLPARRQP
ncbi:MAG TPA: hypothetical protein VGN22_05055 [Pseudonocardia sp.]